MISSSNTVHPGRKKSDGTYSDARTFSVLEAMLIMGLPFGWKLPEGIAYRKAIHYIGEGLCPRVLKALLEPLV
jgi:DNA (cytosine-5)-methyltransferase 1